MPGAHLWVEVIQVIIRGICRCEASICRTRQHMAPPCMADRGPAQHSQHTTQVWRSSHAKGEGHAKVSLQAWLEQLAAHTACRSAVVACGWNAGGRCCKAWRDEPSWCKQMGCMQVLLQRAVQADTQRQLSLHAHPFLIAGLSHEPHGVAGVDEWASECRCVQTAVLAAFVTGTGRRRRACSMPARDRC